MWFLPKPLRKQGLGPGITGRTNCLVVKDADLLPDCPAAAPSISRCCVQLQSPAAAPSILRCRVQLQSSGVLSLSIRLQQRCPALQCPMSCATVCRFMAPEVLSSQVWPASDVWSAGVMTYQLLSGQLPFDDQQSRDGRALSKIW